MLPILSLDPGSHPHFQDFASSMLKCFGSPSNALLLIYHRSLAKQASFIEANTQASSF